MKKLIEGSDTGYDITDGEECYYIFISSEEDNESRHYEYSKNCGTLEEVEKELQECTYGEIVKRYHDQWVYCECIEELY